MSRERHAGDRVNKMKRGDLVTLKKQNEGFYHWNSTRDPKRRGFYLVDKDTRTILNGSLHSNKTTCVFGTGDLCLVLETFGDQILVMNSSCQSGLIERGLVEVVK